MLNIVIRIYQKMDAYRSRFDRNGTIVFEQGISNESQAEFRKFLNPYIQSRTIEPYSVSFTPAPLISTNNAKPVKPQVVGESNTTKIKSNSTLGKTENATCLGKEQEIKSLQVELQQAQSKFSSENAKLTNMQTMNNELLQQNINLKASLEQKGEELEKKIKELGNKGQENFTLRSECETTQKNLTKQSEEKASLLTANSQLKAKIISIEQEFLTVQKTLNEKESNIAQLELANQTLLQQNQATQQAFKQAQQQWSAEMQQLRFTADQQGKELEKSKEENARLQQANQRLSQESQAKISEKTNFAAKNRELTESLERKQAENIKLQESVFEVTKQLQDTSKQLDDADSSLKAILTNSAELSRTGSGRKAGQNGRSQIQATISKIKQTFERMKNDLNNYADEKKLLEKSISNLEKENKDCQNRVKGLNESLSQVQQEKKKIEEQTTTIAQQSKSQLEQVDSSLTEILKSYRTSNTKSFPRKQTGGQTLSSLASRINEQLKEIKEAFDQLQKALSQTKIQKIEFLNEKTKAEKALEQTKNELKGEKEAVIKWKNDFSQCVSNRATIVNEYTSKINARDEEIKNYQKAFKQKSEELEANISKIKQLETDISSSRTRNIQLEAENTTLKEKRTEQDEKHKKAVKACTTEKQTLEKKNAVLQTKNSELMAQNKETKQAQQIRVEWDADRKRLNGVINELNKQNQNLTRTLGSKDVKLTELEQLLRSCQPMDTSEGGGKSPANGSVRYPSRTTQVPTYRARFRTLDL
jgi:chromosome segregation ATPase